MNRLNVLPPGWEVRLIVLAWSELDHFAVVGAVGWVTSGLHRQPVAPGERNEGVDSFELLFGPVLLGIGRSECRHADLKCSLVNLPANAGVGAPLGGAFLHPRGEVFVTDGVGLETAGCADAQAVLDQVFIHAEHASSGF